MMHKLPNQWKRIKLGAIATFSQGIQVGVEKQVTEPQEGFQRFIRIVDYTQIGSNDIRYVPRVSNRYFASKEDIVMIRYGTPGLIGRGIEGVIANNMFKITFKDTVDNNFAEQYLKFPETINEINKGSASSTMPAINFGFLKNLDFIVPPLPEQQKIAEILSTVDEKIEAIDQRIAETQDLKKGLMQQLLTKGIGHTQFKDSPLGEIPESWEVKNIGGFADVTAGGTPSTKEPLYWGGNIPWMNSGEINLRRINSVEGRITELGLSNSSTKLIPKQSVLMALAGQGKTRGKVAINEIELCTNQSLATIFNFKNAHYEFIFQNLESRYDELRKMSTGDGGRGGLNLKIIKSVKVAFPPYDEQKKIAEILSSVDEKLQIQQDKKNEYQELKKGLMQQLLTGKIRVKI